MEADVEGLIGAGRHERTGDRLNYRKGYRERSLDTRLGSLQLRIPKLRQGSYFQPFLEPRKTAEKALVMVIQEAWIGVVSTRRVDELVQAMGLAGISKARSRSCARTSMSGSMPSSTARLTVRYMRARDSSRRAAGRRVLAARVLAPGKAGFARALERGRVCRARLAALRRGLKFLAGGVTRALSRQLSTSREGARSHAATASCQCAAASARKARSVDRETRWR